MDFKLTFVDFIKGKKQKTNIAEGQCHYKAGVRQVA
jgi:hypothetical protein